MRGVLCAMLSLVAVSSVQSQAGGPTLLADQRRISLGPQAFVLEDPTGSLGPEQLTALPWRERFEANAEPVVARGYSSSAFWLRVSLRNTDSVSRRYFLEVAFPAMDRLDLYWLKEGQWKHSRAGDSFRVSERELAHRNHIFVLELAPQEHRVLYLRAHTTSSMILPLVLWSDVGFAEKVAVEMLALGAFYGIGIILVLYNLFLLYSVRDITYVYYVAYVLALLFVRAGTDGTSGLVLWPEQAFLNNPSVLFSVVPVVFFLLLFARRFLDTATGVPRLHRVTTVVLQIQGAVAISVPLAYVFVDYRLMAQATMAVGLSGVVLVAIVGLVRVAQANRQAFYFLSSLSGFIAGAVMIILARVEILQPSILTEYGLHFGAAIEMTLLSLGLGDRIKTLEREKEAAQRRVVESQARQMAKMEQMDRLKDEFLANTSHELRTPLHGIVGIAESLLEGAAGKLNPAMKSNLSLVSASGRRLASLVNDILDYSRLENEDLVLRRRPVDVHQVVNMVLALSRPLVVGKQVTLQDALPAELPAAWADEERLEQILLNLVGNAIKFTKEGTITVAATSNNGHIEVSVRDTGIGIPTDKQALVFDSFTQADGSIAREYGGAGLGLTVSKKLVELHGSRIELESAPGVGSRFSFRLPVASSALGETSAIATTEANSRRVWSAESQSHRWLAPEADEPDLQTMGPADSGKASRTLIVDDDPTNLRVLRNFLSLRGHTVTDAISGRDALAALEVESFDLVLLDVMMPGLSGYEVCRIVREKYSESQLPVIMLTARNRVEDLEAGLASGANDYLAKPFDLRELSARIGTMLKLKAAAESQSRLEVLSYEVELAREIQQALLPRQLPQSSQVSVAARYRSADQVGGDFYDFVQDERGIGAIVADVCGHGIPAALIVSEVKMAYRHQSGLLRTPQLLLSGMNASLLGNVADGFVTAVAVYVDFEGRRILCANGGHPPLLVHRRLEERILSLRPMGRVLGSFADCSFQLEAIDLQSGDILLLYTDGLIEAMDDSGEQYGQERLESFLLEHPRLKVEELAEALLREHEQRIGTDVNPSDDVAIVVLEVH